MRCRFECRQISSDIVKIFIASFFVSKWRLYSLVNQQQTLKKSAILLFFFSCHHQSEQCLGYIEKKNVQICADPKLRISILKLSGFFFVPSFNLSFTLRIIRYHHKRRTKQGTNILVDAVFILNTDNWQFHVGLNICHFHFVLFLLRLAMATIVSYYLTWFVFII